MQNPDVKSVAWPYSFEGKPTATSFYVMTSEVIARDPQAVSNFVGALNRGIDWANANYHTPAYVDLVSDYTRIPKDKLVPIFETPWEFRKSPDVASIETIAQLMLKYGLLKSAPDVSRILYPSKA